MKSIKTTLGPSGVLLLAAMLLAVVPRIAMGGVPQLINFQGQLKNSGGGPLANDTLAVEFKIYNDASAGNMKWSEIDTVITDANGLFTILLGKNNPVPDSAFNDSLRWLGIKVGSDAEISPRTQIGTLGYVYRVSTVDGATGGNLAGDLTVSGDLGVGTVDPQSPFVAQGASNWGVAELVGTSGVNAEASIGFRPSSLSKGGLGSWVLGVNNNAGLATAFSLYAANGLGAGSQVLSVLTSGNVGIGRFNPGYKLDVNGIINATDIYKNGSPFSASQWTTSGANIYYNTGNVGIGTSSPAAKFHVNGAAEGVRIQGTVTGVSNLAYESFFDNVGTRIGYVGDGSTGDNDVFLDADLGNVVLNTPGGRVLTATSTGNVGIGTPSPAKRLTVAGSMEIGTGHADYQHLRIGGGNNSGFLYGSYPRYGDGIHLGYNYYADGAGNPVIIAGDGGTTRFSLGYGSMGMFVGAIGSEPTYPAIFVNSLEFGGLVGIGTSSVFYRLDVAGQAHATTFISSSDIRLKKNIEPLTSVLDKIGKIRGVTFDWNETYEKLGRSSGHREIGVIAQDVEKVFPELVSQWGDQNYRAVDYGRMTAVLIEAIKEQQKEIDELKTEIGKLKDQPNQTQVEN